MENRPARPLGYFFSSHSIHPMGIISNMLGHRCPRCHQGELFLHKNPFNFRKLGKMPPSCPVCGQDFVIEPGFYFGASYISYAFNVAWLIPSFLFTKFVLDWELQTYMIFVLILLPGLTPLIFRLSRSVWIHIFVKYDPAFSSQTAQGAEEK